MNSYGVGGGPTVEWDVVDSGIGPLLLAATATGLVTVAFHARPAVREATLDQLRIRFGTEPVAAPGSARLAEPISELAAYFAGEPRDLDLVLDWSLTSGFHREVLRELASGVPYGTVVGYGELAARVGRPEGAQAVGAAMGPTHCRWWCRATGWWRATGAWADSAGGWRPSGSCWRWRGCCRSRCSRRCRVATNARTAAA